MKPRKRWSPEFCDDIQGARREEIINEHLAWLTNKHAPPRDLTHYPLAQWLVDHRAELARHRSETLAFTYRNTKLARRGKPIER